MPSPRLGVRLAGKWRARAAMMALGVLGWRLCRENLVYLSICPAVPLALGQPGTFFCTCFTSGSPQELGKMDQKVRRSSPCANSAQGWGRGGASITQNPADTGHGPEKCGFSFLVEDSVHCCVFSCDCPVFPTPFSWVGAEAPFCSTDLCVWFYANTNLFGLL